MADVRVTKTDQVHVGDFAKFIGRDDAGRFSYTGEVINLNVNIPPPLPAEHAGHSHKQITTVSFEMRTFEGIMGFDITTPEDHELYITTVKPTGWAKFIQSLQDGKKPDTVVTVEPLLTKRDKISALIASNPKKDEGALLKLAKKQIGGSESQLKNYIKLALRKK